MREQYKKNSKQTSTKTEKLCSVGVRQRALARCPNKKSSDFSENNFFLFFFAGELNLMAEEAEKLLSQREEEWERLAAKASEV
jgi:hypothetical protein